MHTQMQPMCCFSFDFEVKSAKKFGSWHFNDPVVPLSPQHFLLLLYFAVLYYEYNWQSQKLKATESSVNLDVCIAIEIIHWSMQKNPKNKVSAVYCPVE